MKKLEKLALIFAIITFVLLTIGTISLLIGFIWNFWIVSIVFPFIIFGLISLGMTVAFIIMIEDK